MRLIILLFVKLNYLAISDNADVTLSSLLVEFAELLFFHVIVDSGHTDDKDDCDENRHAFEPAFSDTFVDAADHEGNECCCAKQTKNVFFEATYDLYGKLFGKVRKTCR